MYEDAFPETQPSHFPWKPIVAVLVGLCVFVTLLLGWLMGAPSSFQPGAHITIAEGSTVRSIAKEAHADGLVRSSRLLYAVLVLLHDHKSIYAGTYTFAAPVNTIGVAKELISKKAAPELIKVTIPEGSTNAEAAAIAHNALPDFSTSTYLSLASTSEGYLFPDTYLVAADFTPADLIALQKKTFTEHIAPLQSEIQANKLSEQDIITLASLLEREANTATSMKMVAGILENRLKLDMPLQVDATVAYAAGKSLQDFTAADIKVDSPYNTYKNRGLPPTPIDNPGLLAISAVLDPTPSKDLYYITDKNGVFHYAKTLSAHNANVARYLKK